MRVGLRFDRSQAPALRALANRIRLQELPGDIATFEQAELAARTGEPLEVHCTDVTEALRLAAGYTRCGVTPTAIETLTG